MLLVDRGRAVAGLCYVENLIDAAVLALGHAAAPGHAFNVSDGLDVTWKEFTDGLAKGLGCSSVRWSLPYWIANGIGFSLEHGYRLLRKTTRLRTPPLLSRQAVHVLGRHQDFSNRKARELLGWEPRVGYAAGLEATLAWAVVAVRSLLPCKATNQPKWRYDMRRYVVQRSFPAGAEALRIELLGGERQLRDGVDLSR